MQVADDDLRRQRVQVVLPRATLDKLEAIEKEYATSRSQAITIAVRSFQLTERLREEGATSETQA